VDRVGVFCDLAVKPVALVLLRASNTYVLRNDSLEIRSGILTSKSFVLSPSGFSDLEVIRSVSARIVNSGDIIIRTQSETDSVRRMVRVRNPLAVADQIREVMARPIVRIDRSDLTEEKK
jgi:Bacterial PH domain